MGCLSCASIILTAASVENGATLSCSNASSSAISSGKRSRRVDNSWPNLMGTGPRDSSADLRRSPRGAESAVSLLDSSQRSTLLEPCGKNTPNRCLRAVVRNAMARFTHSLRSKCRRGFSSALAATQPGQHVVPYRQQTLKSRPVPLSAAIDAPLQG